MKYLKKFNNTSEYETFKVGGKYVTPNVSLITDINTIMYNPKTNEGVWQLIYEKTEGKECIVYDTNRMESLTIDGQNIELNLNKTVYLSNEDIELVHADDDVEIAYVNMSPEKCFYNPKNISISITKESVQNIIGFGVFLNFENINVLLSNASTIFIPLDIDRFIDYFSITENDKYLTMHVIDDFFNTFHNELTILEPILGVSTYSVSFGAYSVDNNYSISFIDLLINGIDGKYHINSNGTHNIEFIMKDKSLTPTIKLHLPFIFDSIEAAHIKKIIIPNSVTSIPPLLFASCTQLEICKLSDNINVIDGYAFSYCKALTEIVIPNNVNYIGDYCFASCENIETIIMPNSVTDVGIAVFDRCRSLKNLILSENISILGGFDADGFIGFCTSLEHITLPKNITELHECSIIGCSSLSSIRCEAIEAPNLVENAIGGLPSTGILYYPEGSDYSAWIAELPSGWTTETFVP